MALDFERVSIGGRADFGVELLGLYGQLTKDSPHALLDGEIEHAYRSGIFLRSAEVPARCSGTSSRGAVLACLGTNV